MIQYVFHISVGRYSGIDFVPAPDIQKEISRRVSDAKAVKVGVGTWADETASEISTPTGTKVGEQRGGGVPGPPDKRASLCIRKRRTWRRQKDLGRSVSVGGVPGELLRQPA